MSLALAVLLCAVSVFAQNVQPVAPARSTASWTSSTSNNTALTVITRNMASVKVTLHATSTMSVGVLNFEVNDSGSTWFATNCRRDGGTSLTGQSESTYTLSAVDQTWVCFPNGATNFRIRLNPQITGTGTAALTVLPLAFGANSDIIGVYVTNGSTTVTQASTLTQNQANAALTASVLYANDGSNEHRLASDTNGYLKTIFGSAQTIGLAAGTAYAGKIAPWADGSFAAGAVTSAMSGTTSTQVIAGTASNYIYVTQCTTSNASTTVSTDILLQDGSGGTTLYVLPAPAASVATTGGGGGAYQFPTPLKVTTSGNGLFAANVTTGSSTKISCSGFKSTTSF